MSDATAGAPDDGLEVVIAEAGVEPAVKRIGEGPAVLLAGGLGMPSITWDICGLPQSLFDAGLRVIAYNACGMSPSSAPPAPYSVAGLARDAAAILDHFQIGRATVVGYSMGCYTAQMLLRSRPELVGALVLFAGLQPSPVSAIVGEMELGLIERYGQVPREVMVFEQLLTMLHTPMLQDPATVTGWRQVLSAGHDSGWAGPDGFAGTAGGIPGVDHRRRTRGRTARGDRRAHPRPGVRTRPVLPAGPLGGVGPTDPRRRLRTDRQRGPRRHLHRTRGQRGAHHRVLPRTARRLIRMRNADFTSAARCRPTRGRA